MTEHYSYDFPELIIPPAASYARTLELQGLDKQTATVQLLRLDFIVKTVVELAGDPMFFGCTATETITEGRLVSELQDYLPDELDEGLWACMTKAVKVIRGEMEPCQFWTSESQKVC